MIPLSVLKKALRSQIDLKETILKACHPTLLMLARVPWWVSPLLKQQIKINK